MKKRSLFKNIFKKNENVTVGTALEVLGGYNAVFYGFGGNIYNSPTARACIDTIARHGAKLNPKHIRKSEEGLEVLNYRIGYLLNERPNVLMNAYDFYYKVISMLYLYNNVYIYISRDEKGHPDGLYPMSEMVSTITEDNGHYFVKFEFANGKIYTAPYNDVIHLRRFYCENDVLGGSVNPLKENLELQKTTKEGIANAIKLTANLKGIIKSPVAMLDDKDMVKLRDNFVTDFVKSGNDVGIAAIDAKSEFIPVNLDPKTATDSQMKEIKDDILEYFGLSKEILNGTYDEEKWNAFYTATIEPLSLQMSLEFTNKLFTAGQKAFGNKIIFETERLHYASNKTKIEIARYLNNYLTKNEIREIFNMAPDPDGDFYLQDLNHISSEIANEYQGGKE